MSNAPEDFEKLQKLLKLKRYEQPPPGYFNNFSTHVINRLERQAEEDGWSGVLWLKRFLGLLETNPFAAGVFGMSVCGLLISGIAYSQYRTDSTYTAESNVTIGMGDTRVAANAPEWSSRVVASVDSLSPSTLPTVGTNDANALFEGIKNLGVQPVNFQLNQ